MPSRGTGPPERTAESQGATTHFASKLILLQVGILVVLALGATWLIQREERARIEQQAWSQGRAAAEFIAVAAGPDPQVADEAYLIRVLQTATRHRELLAGAILDASGKILAHTDLVRLGGRLDQAAVASLLERHPRQLDTALLDRLFAQEGGFVAVHPLFNSESEAGVVALLLAKPALGAFGQSGWKLLMPTALIILAVIGFTNRTIRRAQKPAANFVDRLGMLLEEADAARRPLDGLTEDQAMNELAGEMRELIEAREALTIENRVLLYERKRRGIILDHLTDGIIVVDPVNSVLTINRAAAKLTGLVLETSLGQDIEALPEPLGGLLNEALATGQASLADDGDRHIVIKRIPLADSGGERLGTLFTLRDATAQQAAMRAQGEFLSQIAHELKAPLNTIVTYIDALADEDLLSKDERREYSNNLGDEARRMARLIANLLQLSRIQLGNLSARFGFVKSGAMIQGLTDSLRSQIEGKGQRFEVSIPENLPPLYGDKDLLCVAITNLITNAAKYTPADGRIAVRAAEEETGLVIEIEDTGIGIPAEEQDHIFERFARSGQAEVQAQSGTGLGLSLVREIAEIHDGEVSVVSSPGAGSTFKFRLPSRDVSGRFELGAA